VPFEPLFLGGTMEGLVAGMKDGSGIGWKYFQQLEDDPLRSGKIYCCDDAVPEGWQQFYSCEDYWVFLF